MKPGTARNPAVTPLLLLLGALALTGCSHQVLTFFFTGVPEPGQQPAAETETSAARRDGPVRRNPYFTHGPYGAGSCGFCHKGARNSAFGQPVSTGAAGVRGVSPSLVQPLAELCVGCHSDRHSPGGQPAATWLHGPVANGQCTACHSPHKSTQRYLLLKDNGPALCGQCHSAADLQQTPQHAADPLAECTGCHNAHAGQDRLLLKADYDERSRFDQG